MTDKLRAELRRGIEGVIRLAVAIPDPQCRTNGTARENEAWVQARTYKEFLPPGGLPPLTTAQQLALSVLLGEPDTVVESALADMLMDAGHEYATAVAEKARAEEREKPAHLSPGSPVTMYGMSGHVHDVNVSTRIDGRMECEIRVVLLPGREESTD